MPVNEKIIYHSRPKMSLVAIGSLLFVLAAVPIWLVLSKEGGSSRIFGLLLCVVDVLFFGACFFYAARRLFSSRPALIFSDEGFYDDTSAVGAGKVAWGEVMSFHIGKVGRQRFVCIVPTDVEGFLQRQPSWKAGMMRQNVGLVGAPITLSALTLPMSLEALLAEIEQYHAAHGGRSI